MFDTKLVRPLVVRLNNPEQYVDAVDEACVMLEGLRHEVDRLGESVTKLVQQIVRLQVEKSELRVLIADWVECAPGCADRLHDAYELEKKS